MSVWLKGRQSLTRVGPMLLRWHMDVLQRLELVHSW